MKKSRGASISGLFGSALETKTVRGGFVLLVVGLLGSPFVLAHSPVVDADLSDWCIGAESNTATGGGRVEDSGVFLTCGNCSVATDKACVVNSDCGSGEGSCVNPAGKTETAWWDDRTDGAVNDLATVAITNDDEFLYIAAELWVDPDPVSLPFGQIAIDYAPGGLDTWHDPNGFMAAAGRCSGFTDRACTSDADCDFCQISTEPTGECSVTASQRCVENFHCPSGEICERRKRTCGSACDVGDVCNTSQTCTDIGLGGLTQKIGLYASPTGLADYIVLFDFSFWLIGAGDSVRLLEPGIAVDASSPWDPVLGCGLPTDPCDFPPAVNPGASGGSGGPPGSVEVAIPWSAFGCTGCPDNCVCPGFGPDEDYRFTMTVSRGTLTLDFKPDGSLEDVMTEPVAGATSTTTNDCPGTGAGNTSCEIADKSMDAFILVTPSLPHEVAPGGHVTGLLLTKNANSSVTLDWIPSCSSADNDYEVYEGFVGTWTTHQPVVGLCTTGGAATATFFPGASSHYFVVVPTDGSTEGSYGLDGASAERPASTAPCTSQSVGNCP